MTSIYPAPPSKSFSDLLSLLQQFPAPLTHPPKPQDPSLSDSIASLYLHPALEALLHILNHDLYSAHFLVRAMQSPPAYEAMYCHGILHRIEGDFDNSRAWYSDVSDWEGFTRLWGKSDASAEEGGQKLPRQRRARDFLDRVEKLVRHGGDESEKTALMEESRRELDSLLQWCLQKFGTEKVKDANQDFVKPTEEISKKAGDQVSGSGGPRKF